MKTFDSHSNGYDYWIALGCFALFFAGVYFYRHYEEILNIYEQILNLIQ